MKKIVNNTRLINDLTVSMLFKQFAGNAGRVSCPIGTINYEERLDGTIEATSTYKNYGRLD